MILRFLCMTFHNRKKKGIVVHIQNFVIKSTMYYILNADIYQ